MRVGITLARYDGRPDEDRMLVGSLRVSPVLAAARTCMTVTFVTPHVNDAIYGNAAVLARADYSRVLFQYFRQRRADV